MRSQLHIRLGTAITLTVLVSLSPIHSSKAQVTAFWNNSLGGEWSTAANWDQGIVPGAETNVSILSGYSVTYDLPMAAPSVGSLTLGGSLSINASGFTVDGGTTNTVPFTVSSGGVLNINNNGVVTLANATNASTITGTLNLAGNGALTLTNCGVLSLGLGGLMNFTGGVFTMTNSAGSAGLTVGLNGRNNGTTNVWSGATVTLDKVLTIQGGNSGGNPASTLVINGGTLNSQGGTRIFNSQDDTHARLIVDGGAVVNLGSFLVQRGGAAGGLILSNGVVTASSIQIGAAASKAYSSIYGGVLTNTGPFTINDTTNSATSSDRRSQFLIRGGTVVSTGAGGIVVANQSNNGGSVSGSQIGGILDINAGTLVAEGITLIKDTTLTNAFARLNLGGSGAIYLGSLGLVANVGFSNTAYALTLSGGTLGAKADWASAVPLPLSGTVTFKAGDSAGTAHNIALSGRISGTGQLTKSGGGTLTLSATNNYTANTVVNEGTLALAATGSVSNTLQITVAGGAVYDVSAVSGAALLGSQTLSGSGSVAGSITALGGSAIRPGGLLAAGTLTFSNSLTQAGGVTTTFDLSQDPAGTVTPNDMLNILGDLNLSGTNTIFINALNGALPVAAAYKLVQYGGNLNGDLANFTLGGVNGLLSNDIPGKAIYMVVAAASRAPTNVTWLGGLGGNTWDSLATSNWLNVATAARDIFVAGDNVRFDATGATNPVINLVGSVGPSALVVDTASNYVFSGSGSIDGVCSLIKTNTGMLTILATNGFSGPTIIGGGILEAVRLAGGGINSSLGSATSDPTNLQFFGASLRYLGPSASTDRGATLNDLGGTIEVTNPSATLTLSGTIAGNGGLNKAGPGALTLSGSGAYAGPTVTSNGTLLVNTAIGALGTNVVTFAGGGVTLNVSGQQTYSQPLSVLTTGSLTSAGGNNNIVTGPWSGAGALNVSIASSGTFSISGDMTTNFTGTILVTTNSNGFLRFNSGGSDPCKGSAMATFDLGNSSVTLVNRNGSTYGTTVYYLGGLAGGTSTTVRGSANNGTPNTYQIGDNNQSTTFAGVITTGAGGTAAVVSILKAGTGTLTFSGTNTYTGSTTVSNGVLALSGYGSIRNSAIINVLTNTVLDASTRADGALALTSGQTLAGEGTVRGSVTVADGAGLSPGDNPGVTPVGSSKMGIMTITSSLVLEAGSTTYMDLDYYNWFGGGTNDEVVSPASVTYGGTLKLNISSVETNAVFKLFSAASYHGAFAAIDPAQPPGLIPSYLVWDTSYLTVDGTLRITMPRPKITSFGLQGTDLVMTGSNGIPFASYYVLSSTNVALPAANWTSVATNVFEWDGSFNVTNVVDPNKPKEFYLLAVPQ